MTERSKRMKLMMMALLLTGVAVFSCLLLRSNGWKDPDLSGEPDAVSSTVRGGVCSLTVTANAAKIEDKGAFAREIVRMCRENSFPSLRLSTDIGGWPEELDISVYLQREDVGVKEPVMQIVYEPADQDADISIQDDPEKYILTIE